MTLFLAIAVAIFPILVVMSYVIHQDRIRPEPKGLVIKIFFIGFLFTLPTVILQLLTTRLIPELANQPLINIAYQSFFVAAIFEEFFKLLVVKRFIYDDSHFDEILDGIVYAIVASMGFACLENILYVIQGGMPAALLRAFTAVPLHALATGLMGYYVGMAKFASTRFQEQLWFLRGYALAVLIHGVYNFLLQANSILWNRSAAFVFPLLLLAFFLLRHKIRNAQQEDKRTGRTEPI